MISPKRFMRIEPVVLTDFEGDWSLTRDIAHADGTSARFEGQAVWRPGSTGCDYHEQGVLQMPGATALTAERRYQWTPDLSVFFEDGRFFHKVPQQGGQTQHWCDPDHYVGHYAFDHWPQFTVVWHVTGPRKDYKMTSYYVRSAG